MTLPGLPYLLALTAVLSFGAAWKVQGWRHDAAILAAQIDTQELVAKNQVLQGKAATAFAEGQASTVAREVVVEKEVIRVVSKPEYRGDCLDADGLRIVSADIDAANARRGLAAAVPASAPAR